VINTSEISVSFVSTILVFLGYIGFFWRTFKSNPGNRLVECGSMTLIAFFAFLALASLNHPGKVPDWLILSWLTLVFLLCLSTLFFLAQRAYQAVRRKRRL
jgi:predicted MFS family arabinose efflux permease